MKDFGESEVGLDLEPKFYINLLLVIMIILCICVMIIEYNVYE